jgi:DNA polymerase V
MSKERYTYPSPGLRFYALERIHEITLIHIDGAVCAGFPSPADDYLETSIDLRRELVKNPDATFVVRVQGHSMVGDGIDDGDVLIVDRSLKPRNGAVAVCYLNQSFTVKRLEMRAGQVRLLASNPDFAPIEVFPHDELVIWGIVTFVIKKTG